MNKKIVWVVGVIALVFLLAGAAYAGMRLINGSSPLGQALQNIGLGPIMGKIGGSGGGIQVAVMLNRAAELPASQPDLVGLVTDIKGNSLFVKAQQNFIVSKGVTTGTSNGGPVTNNDGQPDNTGPTTEVVITKDTKIWRDATMDKESSMIKTSGSYKIQQIVEPATAQDIATDMPVQVWGQKRGDRLNADVVLVEGAIVVK